MSARAITDVPRGMTWPTAAQYETALLAIEGNGGKGLVKNLSFEHDAVGYLEMVPGSFGYVYHARNGKRQFALKVFSKDAPGRRERYKRIHDHLRAAKSLIFVEFRFADREIWVTNDLNSPDWFPVVRMQWCTGTTLDTALAEAQHKSYDPRKWTRAWLDLLCELRRTQTAHGDLQHGNIIVERNRAMRLIDYDGMFVPSMSEEMQAIESGHPAYQHPSRQRTGVKFDGHIDGVSALVILLSLAGLTPELWRERDDEGLLLGSNDLNDPDGSDMLQRLNHSPEPAPQLVVLLRQALDRPPGPCPELDRAADLYGVTLPPVGGAPSTGRSGTTHPVNVDLGVLAESGRHLLPWEAKLRNAGRTPRPASDAASAVLEGADAEPARAAFPPLTDRQVLTLASTAAGLSEDQIAMLRRTQKTSVRRQLARLAARLGETHPDTVLGFRLSRRQAEVVELRLGGVSEAECVKELGRGATPATARRHLAQAISRFERSPLKGAQQLVTSLRALDASPAPPSKPAKPKRIQAAPQRKPPTQPAQGEPTQSYAALWWAVAMVVFLVLVVVGFLAG